MGLDARRLLRLHSDKKKARPPGKWSVTGTTGLNEEMLQINEKRPSDAPSRVRALFQAQATVKCFRSKDSRAHMATAVVSGGDRPPVVVGDTFCFEDMLVVSARAPPRTRIVIDVRHFVSLKGDVWELLCELLSLIELCCSASSAASRRLAVQPLSKQVGP